MVCHPEIIIDYLDTSVLQRPECKSRKNSTDPELEIYILNICEISRVLYDILKAENIDDLIRISDTQLTNSLQKELRILCKDVSDIFVIKAEFILGLVYFDLEEILDCCI
jgi:hypothetical protein